MWWFVWIGMNVVGYTLMGIDKRRAIQGKWRISEKALFTCAGLLLEVLECTRACSNFGIKRNTGLLKSAFLV